MKISDLADGGYWPLQHHEKATPIGEDWSEHLRILRFGCRVIHEEGRRKVDKETAGPVLGGHLWKTNDGLGYPNVWSFATPGKIQGLSKVSPVKGPDWSTIEDRLEQASVSFSNNQSYPKGWSAVVLDNVNFNEQNLLGVAGFDGLVAPHLENRPKLGTPVWDLSGGGLGPRARLQSLTRLYEPPQNTKCLDWGEGHHLAIQLGRSTDGAGFGVFADDPDKLTTGGLQDLATGNKRGGGPFDVGGPSCPHVHGSNPRGETMRALHLTTGTLFRSRVGIGDGPFRFLSKLYDQYVFDAPFKTKVRVLWNPERIHSWGCGVANGVWEPQGESFFSLVIPPEKPPGELIPRFPSEPLVGGDDDEFDPSQPPDPSELGEDGSPLFSRNSNFTDPRDYGGERIGNFRETSRPLYGSSLELAFPAIVGRAQHYSKGADDFRSLARGLTEDHLENWACLPATIRHEYFGAQVQELFDENQRKLGGRYQNVPTANGGRVNMPPELGLEFLVEEYSDLTDFEYSTTYEIDWKIRRGRGTPILEGDNAGGLSDGFSDYYDESTKRWVTYHHDANGDATLVREYDSQGRDRQLCIATYGDGDDGDVTTSGTTLTTNMHYENLTLNASATISAPSVIVRVKDTLTINSGAKFSATEESGESGVEGGAGGTGASELWFGASAGGGAGGNNGAGTAGSSSGPSLGGAGGAGGSGNAGANAGGAGGSATAPTHFPRSLEPILHGQNRDLSGYEGGGGGGGAGSGAGVQAPGGGAGGGVMVIVARHLVLDNSGGALFESNGAAGGEADTTNSGGAGGGGGGFVCVIYQTAEDHNGNQLSEAQVLALISVVGGSAGLENGTGGKGVDGSVGTKIVLKHG